MIKIDVKKDLSGAFGKMQLDFQANVAERELVALYGPSGAGKTSILKMLCGLMKPETGSIMVGDQVWYDSAKKINLRPQQRNVGMVFQDYGLFPHMSVKQHLSFALPKNGKSKEVEELLDFMDLRQMENSKPNELSGGQQQRVALARTLVRRPKVLLLDEPLSAVDQEMRTELQQHIKNIHHTFGLTTLLVSHEMEEVLRLSDRIIMIENGKLVKQGKATEVFELDHNLSNPTVEVLIIEVSPHQPGSIVVSVNGQLKRIPYTGAPPEVGTTIKLKINS